ncbi:hypothetical protein D0Z03_002020 [Geotrichum reessii]|nr:hypothetical protein D0Z03_002020 [Galactomyces reessii]
MGPKKMQKLSLFEFQNETGAWADEEYDFTANNEPTPAASTPFVSSYAKRKEELASTAAATGFNIPDHPPFTIKFSNLDFSTTEEDIYGLFDNSFHILEVKVPLDVDSGRSRGYAYVDFEDRESLIKATEFNHTPLRGRNVRVVIEKGRERRPRREPREPRPSEDGVERDFDNWGGRRGPLDASDNNNRDFGNWGERRGPLGPKNDNEPNWGERRGPLGAKQDNEPNWGERRGPLGPRQDSEPNWGERRGPIQDRPHREERDLNWGERRGPLQDKAPREESEINWGERRGPLQDKAPRQEREINWGERRGPIHEKPHREERNINWGERRGPISDKPQHEEPEINWGERRGPLSEKKRGPRPSGRREKPEDAIPDDNWRSAGPRNVKGKASDNASSTQGESSNSSKKVDNMNKSFGVLSLDDEHAETTTTSQEKVETKKQEALTAAEQILSAEAPKEELEADGWNVVPNKKVGRK